MATILVVDDEADVRRFLKTVLGYKAHHILEAADGFQALSVFDTEKAELVIADVVMPGMDGLDFLRRLRVHPRGRSIPVIIHTGLTFDDKAHAVARACGVHWVVEKPSLPRTILDVVDQALRAPPVEVQLPAEFERDHLQLLADQLTRKLHELHDEMARRERVESERDRLLQQLRLQIDRLPLAFLQMDAAFRLLDWNPAAEKTFGYKREEALGQNVIDLILPDPLPDSLREILRRMQAGDMSAHSVNENRTKDSRLITCEWFNTPLLDANGRFAGAISVAQDITQRQQAERRLRESEERFRELAANIDGYFWLNAPDDSEMYYISPGYEKITGYSCESLYQRPASWTEIIHPEDRERVLAVVLKPIHTEGRELEYRIVRPDGSIRWIRDRVLSIRNDAGEIERVAGIGEDITERKQAEAKLQEYYERVKGLSRQLLTVQEEERRHLARELHDEIGQVLSAISVNLKVVKSKVAPDAWPRLEESIGMVDRAVDQVRNLSLDLRPSMLDDFGLESALRWYVDRLAERTGLPVHFSAESSLLDMPGGVRNACFRVAQEALTNVVRHAQAKEVWVHFHGQDEEVRLEIRDNGIGFDVAMALERALHGASLGLLGMQERGELLGGRVQISSQPGQGATVRAWWPLTGFPKTDETSEKGPPP